MSTTSLQFSTTLTHSTTNKDETAVGGDELMCMNSLTRKQRICSFQEMRKQMVNDVDMVVLKKRVQLVTVLDGNLEKKQHKWLKNGGDDVAANDEQNWCHGFLCF
ncbi:hypothetical protein C5167_017499 [Papaver somniferum]|uniref:Uncharacterized protein n=1 Tax=Papaver somniferum TaxID=3469 RepID=A0A4Y7INK8_PAPSO|nr:hypothetical protein C5167_017499 [Papaver somniferum]